MDSSLQKKYGRLQNNIARLGSAAVAFSGGVDSTLLLKTACDVLGDKTIAMLGKSPFQIPSELDEAICVAENIGCRVEVVDFDLASDDEFCENKADRCYYCKKLIYTAFLQKIAQFACSFLMDGTNLDDTLKDRPGARAIDELNVETPLKDSLLTKKDIRLISKELGLSTWNKYSASCMATRILTDKRLNLSDVAIAAEIEEKLNQKGFLGSRLKIGNNCAILSLIQGDHARFITSGTWERIKKILKTKGFDKVFLDLSEREGILT